MKRYRYMIMAMLVAFVLPGQAAEQKGKEHQKTRIMNGGPVMARDLRSAGPVWKNPTRLSASKSSYGTLASAVRSDHSLLAAASGRGLKVRELELSADGTIAFISGELGRLDQLKSAVIPGVTMQSSVQTTQALRDLQLAQSWLETFAPALKLSQPAAELSLSRYGTDELGKRHLRLQQSWQGLPVWANELYVHVDATDQVYAVNGRYAPSPAAIDPAAARIDGAAAVEQSRAHLAAEGRLEAIPAALARLTRYSQPVSQKAIWIDRLGTPRLVWQVDINASVRDWYTVMVDAVSGEVLHKYSNTMSEGSVSASGTDLGGASRSFRAYEQSGTYYMLSDLNELSGGVDNLPDNPTGGLWVIDLQNTDATSTSQFYHVTSSSRTSWGDRSAVSAIYNLNKVYDYYKNTHGRRAIDGNASSIITVVNVTEDGRSMDNAYWNGTAIFWGNGADYFTPLAGALDVAAHELTHGVTEYSANLVYQDQPGALNEAMSDFFGCMVDREDWLMGEDIMRSGTGTALRDVSNPHNSQVLSQLPQTMDEYQYTSEDYGGVHTNCGVPLYAMYLFTGSVGKEKAEKIVYRALTTYLTRQSQFIDARTALEQSATDLYGSTESAAVSSAFDAVKVTKSGGSGGGTTPRGAGENEVNVTTGGSQWIAFVGDDTRLGLYDVANDQDYLLNITVNSKEYNWTQFTATADGYYLYFINSEGVLSRLDLTNLAGGYYNYETFEEYYIRNPGDLWNAAVSRDGEYVALTSIYENDNTIYLLISGELYYVTLEFPSSQTGITSQTIQYPDVLNWSPNTKYPKLAFDAYNQITLDNGTQRSWWNMGEIDFTGSELQVYTLLPAQPEGISVGNVQYSSTDPDRIAYSYIEDGNNYWDVKIENFASHENDDFLQLSGRDIERPSFSPDDRYLVVDRYSDEKLLIIDLVERSFWALDFENTTGARYPEWFVVGGSYDLEVEASPAAQPAGFILEANYPNPFNAGTTISYTLPQSGRVRVAVYDLQGRLVRTLSDQPQAAGRHTLTWHGDGEGGRSLSSGVYLCRVEAEGGYSASQKMVMVK